MARKKPIASPQAPLLPGIGSAVAAPLPGVRPLFLPRLIAEAALQVDRFLPNERDRAHAVFLKWIEDLEAGVIDALSEIQVEQDFYTKLLGALGYATAADVETGRGWTLQPKYGEHGTEKADATLGRFEVDDSGALVGRAVAVVEIKGTRSKDLDRRDASGRSPVRQAWDYLNASDTAKWAVVSNFREVRLYSRDRPSRCLHRVLLTDLVDRDEFTKFFAVFHAGSLLETGPVAMTARVMLDETEHRRETVGDELYRFYAENRLGLIAEIRRKRGTDLGRAIQAAQKLLDRVLFIAFAQAPSRHLFKDRRLLQNTADVRIAGLSVWRAFQCLFRAVDEGDAFVNVPKYNGNLFKRDDILDDPAFELDSERWPNVFKTFGDYDYEHEVTVDVLGRIFEKSITDIEQLHAGDPDRRGEPAAERGTAGRRKTQGVYYTAAYIVEFLVAAALDPPRERRAAELRRELGIERTPDPPPAAFTRGMLAWLDGATVCDPACGSGAFLVAAYNWFEERRLDLLADLKRAEPGAPEADGDPADWRARSAPSILRRNLYGVDLSPEAVEIAQLSLWIPTARMGQTLTDLSRNVVCGNSVVDDAAVDPERAFDWRGAFPEVFARGGFDAVVGNPPYVRQERLAPYKPHLASRFRSFSGAADLYVYFYELGLNLLKSDGRLAYVSSGTFAKANYAGPLRELLRTEAALAGVVDFGEFQPFPDAEMVRPSCVVLRKSTERPSPPARALRLLKGEAPPRDLARALREEGIELDEPFAADGQIRLERTSSLALLDKLRTGRPTLGERAAKPILRGIITGLKEAFIVDEAFAAEVGRTDPNSRRLIHPLSEGTNLRRWRREPSGSWVIVVPNGFTTERSGLADESAAWDWFRSRHPAVADHLAPHEAAARARDDQGRFWWELRPCDYYEDFERPKIVWPDIANAPRFSLDESGSYLGNSAYCIRSDDGFLVALLNSRAIWFVISKTAQPLRLRSGRWQYRCFRQFMHPLPVPKAGKADQTAIGKLAKRASEAAAERYELVGRVARRIEQAFGGAEPARMSEKLRDWPALSFAELGAELRKTYKLPRHPWENPATVDVWEPFRNESRARHEELTRVVSDAEAEINHRVDRLFDLDADESKLLAEETGV